MNLRRTASDPFAWTIGACFYATLVITLIVYWPGLSGDFLLDDYARLPHLGNFGGVNDLSGLLYYLNSAWTGLAGRPLAYLSFLIDHDTWPAPAFDFKYTNLLLHLLNGCLLFAVLQRLLTAYRLAWRQILGLSLFVTAGWLLHPLLVSTTLYIIQRMTILAATFVFLGLLGYLVARERLDVRPKVALIAMTAALGLSGGIGLLAKGNAGLIVPLALLLECTLLPAPRGSRRYYLVWRAVFLIVPTLVLFGYLALRGIEGVGGFDFREFDSIERVLTQTRIVTEYLHLWFIPQWLSPGLYNDDVIISRGLLDPVTTLPAVLFIVALIGFTVYFRRRLPLAAAGIGFFLIGHLLESTTIPLELYFEHRNYLPTALLWLPVGGALLHLPRPGHRTILLAFVIPVTLATLTLFRSNVWGDSTLHAAVATRENPESQRAYRAAAIMLKGKKPLTALEILQTGHRQLPHNLPILFNLIDLQCRLGEPNPEYLDKFRERAKTYEYLPNAFGAYDNMVTLATEGACESVTPHLMRGFLYSQLARLDALRRDHERVPAYEERVNQLHDLLGRLALQSGHPCEAFLQFRRSAQNGASRPRVLKQAQRLTRGGLHWEALAIMRSLENTTSAASSGPWGVSPSSAIHASIRQQLVRHNLRKLDQADFSGPSCALPPPPPQRGLASETDGATGDLPGAAD